MSNSATTSNLQSKVSLTLVLLISAFVIVSYSTLQIVIAPAFDELELSAARSDLHRAEAALNADFTNLQVLTADWGPWDDIYDYVLGRNPGFQKSNLDQATVQNLGLDVMAIYGLDGLSVWGMALSDAAASEIDSVNVFKPEHALFPDLTQHSDPDAETVGIVDTNSGPLLVSSRPILRTDESGPIAGTLVMGRFLDASHLQTLRNRIQVNMNWAMVSADLSQDMMPRFEVRRDFVAAEKILLDIAGQPILQLTTQTPVRFLAWVLGPRKWQ